MTIANPGSAVTLEYEYVPVAALAITPAVGPTTGGQSVTISGTGFTPTTTVDFDGAPATAVVVNADGTSLTAVTPAGAEGEAVVTVTNANGASALAYEYVEPAVASFTPTSGPEYGGTVVTITGTGLGTTTDVDFGGVPADIVSVSADGTSVVVTTPAGEGAVDVILTLAGGSTVPAADEFLYVAPSVASVSPNVGAEDGGTTVTITGDGLEGTTGVLFGDTPGAIVGTPTDTEVIVTTPAGVGTVDVTVEIPGGAIVVPDGFQYVAAPVVTDATPGSGPTSGGTEVVVDGSGFIPGGTTVTICGITLPASEVTVNQAGTQAQFSTPACEAGNTELVVSTAGGSSDALTFRYIAPAAAGTGSNGNNNGGLPDTGSSTTPLVGWSVLLLLTGLMAVGIAAVRRRMA